MGRNTELQHWIGGKRGGEDQVNPKQHREEWLSRKGSQLGGIPGQPSEF